MATQLITCVEWCDACRLEAATALDDSLAGGRRGCPTPMRATRSFDWWFREWLVPFSPVIQLVSGESFRANRVGLWSKRQISKYERTSDRVNLWQAATDPGSRVDFLDRRRRVPPLLGGADFADADLPAMIRQVRSFSGERQTFYGLVASAMVYRDRPLTTRYLDAVTAIETIDTAMEGIGPIDCSTFKSLRKEALATVSDPAAKKFLKRWTASRSAYSLEERLQRTRERLNLTWQHDAATMAALRNDLARGNDADHDDTIEGCFDQALEASRLLALRYLGT